MRSVADGVCVWKQKTIRKWTIADRFTVPAILCGARQQSAFAASVFICKSIIRFRFAVLDTKTSFAPVSAYTMPTRRRFARVRKVKKWINKQTKNSKSEEPIAGNAPDARSGRRGKREWKHGVFNDKNRINNATFYYGVAGFRIHYASRIDFSAISRPSAVFDAP